MILNGLNLDKEVDIEKLTDDDIDKAIEGTYVEEVLPPPVFEIDADPIELQKLEEIFT